MGQVGLGRVAFERRHRRWPWVIGALLILLVGGALIVDLMARSAAESAVARQVKASTRASSVSVHIPWFPFLWQAIADGRVDRVRITADDVPVGLVHLTQVQVVGRNVTFERHELFDSHKLQITRISSGTVTVRTGILGELTLRALDLSRVALIPQCPLTERHLDGGYELSCTVAPVPSSVIAALNS